MTINLNLILKHFFWIWPQKFRVYQQFIMGFVSVLGAQTHLQEWTMTISCLPWESYDSDNFTWPYPQPWSAAQGRVPSLIISTILVSRIYSKQTQRGKMCHYWLTVVKYQGTQSVHVWSDVVGFPPWVQPSAGSDSQARLRLEGTTGPGPVVAVQAEALQEPPESPLAGPNHWTTVIQEKVCKAN